MVSWPDPGTRVTVRYRRPAGSVPALTDAVGHLLDTGPVVRVQTKTGAVVEFAAADVVALRVLTDAPLRTADIRALEHAAARAWPGTERAWLDGWLLRAGGLDNFAVPLELSAHVRAIREVVDWYRRRGLTARLAIPDRLLAPPPGLTAERPQRVMVRDVRAVTGQQPGASLVLSARPDHAWLQRFGMDVATDALTAVDGEVVFGTHPGVATARAAVTQAPDGTRWVGLGALRVHGDARSAAVLGAA
ncbi:MAG: GNAT family N-acetyltransferase, partial [Mycobacterium sp.]|nr:GNAT family N-acetyltransferase [Mycobacterium sp.]